MRYVIEIESAWQVVPANGTTEFHNLKLARIYELAEGQNGWPTKKTKPIITLAATENTEAAAAEQLRMWFEHKTLEMVS